MNWVSDMKKIYVLFFRRHNFIEDLVCFFHCGKYSHTAISLTKTEGLYYSFNLKGFQLEKPKNCLSCVTIFITDEQYKSVELYIKEMHRNQKKWHYSLFGVFLAIIRIPHRIKNHLFCSQFIMKLLQETGIICTKKHPSTTLPNDLYKVLTINKLAVNHAFN